MSVSGTKVYYITGNHDDLLRRFTNLSFGNFELRNDLLLQKNGKRFWFFHGDIFDSSVIEARWLAKLGGKSYDTLVRLNKIVNGVLKLLGKEKVAFSKLIKMKVKEAVKFIGDFEQKAIEIAENYGYDYVICGHIHTPQYRTEKNITYLNSGDWVENLTALEYDLDKWSIYHYNEKEYPNASDSASKDSEWEENDNLILQNASVFVANILNNPIK